MKRVTATEARQNWFGLLDAVAAGEVVVIERHGRRIVLRREELGESAAAEVPDYSKILRVRDLDRADQWGWEWTADGLMPRGDPGDEA
ncbi:MAG: type II toxin-antitoxin system Phd/YefM family antitoxin [Planctomycetota bacterium]|jgi:antitoxin (DNA-binding transcriptional repressor) of toxin-antitoxin stability system